MSKTFGVERPLRFSHCDPAGIVNFAHFFDMFNAAVDDWFDQAIGHNNRCGGALSPKI